MQPTGSERKTDRATSEPTQTTGGFLQSWDRFWFTPADPTVLGLIRIFTGIIAFYALLAYTPDLQEFMGPHAWQDLELRQETYRTGGTARVPLFRWSLTREQLQEEIVETGHPVWSIWFHVTDPTAMMLIHVGFTIASFLFLIGYCSRVTTAITWFALLNYVHRAPGVLFGMDTMMVIVLLYLMIGGSGQALSLDRWLARRRGAAGDVEPSVSTNLAIRLLQIHLCIIYLSAGLSKLQGPAWWAGTAVWGTLANPEFAPMHSELYMVLLRLLGQNRLQFEIAMTLAAYTTLFFEISYAFLIWRPATRRLLLGIAILLHGFIGIFMGLKTFSMIMLVMNLAFVSPEAVKRVIHRLSRGRMGSGKETPPAEPVGDAVKVLKPIRQEKQHRAVASTHVKKG